MIKQEQQATHQVTLNIAGSLRTFAVAAYIAACITKVRLITAIPAYNETNDEVGIESMVEIPVIPLKPLRRAQLQILQALLPGETTMDGLVKRLNPGINVESPIFVSELTRVQVHLGRLDLLHYLQKRKIPNRKIQVQLTYLGTAVAEFAK